MPQKPVTVRRIVKGRIADALEQGRPALEEFISRRLEFPHGGFPYKLAPAAVLIREIRTFKVVPLVKEALPPVQVEVLLKAWLAQRAVELRGGWDPA